MLVRQGILYTPSPVNYPKLATVLKREHYLELETENIGGSIIISTNSEPVVIQTEDLTTQKLKKGKSLFMIWISSRNFSKTNGLPQYYEADHLPVSMPEGWSISPEWVVSFIILGGQLDQNTQLLLKREGNGDV